MPGIVPNILQISHTILSTSLRQLQLCSLFNENKFHKAVHENSMIRARKKVSTTLSGFNWKKMLHFSP